MVPGMKRCGEITGKRSFVMKKTLSAFRVALFLFRRGGDFKHTRAFPFAIDRSLDFLRDYSKMATISTFFVCIKVICRCKEALSNVTEYLENI